MTDKDRTPITDEWLLSVDFKWRQNERQPNRHYKLSCNIKDERWASYEQTTIEVQRSGHMGGGGEYIGDPSLWMLWITDTYDRTAFIRKIKWREEIISLAEVITGRPWRPELHLYGQAWWPESKALADR